MDSCATYTNASEAHRLSNGEGREEEDAEARRIGLRNCIGQNAHRMIGLIGHINKRYSHNSDSTHENMIQSRYAKHNLQILTDYNAQCNTK